MLVFNFSSPSCSHFLLCCSSSENLSEYKTVWPCVVSCNFCIHLRSLNVHHFGMVAATELNNYGVGVTFNSMISLLDFTEIYQLVKIG
jgi:hypothetical protein